MVMVRALQKCFINNMLRQPGDEFDHDGEFSESVMVALEDEAPRQIPKQSRAKKATAKKAVKKTSAGGEVLGLPNDVK